MNNPTRSSEFLAAGCGMLLLIVAPYAACGARAVNDPRVRAVYDTQTGKLQTLIYDANNNGRPDAWSYMDGTRVIRIERDRDEDGVVERWEYYDADRHLTKVGVASGHDGHVDTWVFAGADGKVARIEHSTRRDGAIDRIEFYERDALVGVEQDTDRDDQIDRWQTYTDGRLASVALDTSHQGRADRRFVYRADGSLLRIEHPTSHVTPTPRETRGSAQ